MDVNWATSHTLFWNWIPIFSLSNRPSSLSSLSEIGSPSVWVKIERKNEKSVCPCVKSVCCAEWWGKYASQQGVNNRGDLGGSSRKSCWYSKFWRAHGTPAGSSEFWSQRAENFRQDSSKVTKKRLHIQESRFCVFIGFWWWFGVGVGSGLAYESLKKVEAWSVFSKWRLRVCSYAFLSVRKRFSWKNGRF